MANAIAVSMILLVTMTVVTCQMVQYSRGWTAGKRADHPGFGGADGLPSEIKTNFPTQGVTRRSYAPDTVYCSLHKLKMLRGTNNDQVYQVPCEFLNMRPRDGEANQHLQHDNSHHLAAYDNNNYDDNN
ncbi:pro-corazonin-like [Diachasmimorpha longicaudata]|uniref:pro-corazonin-like n=1 Tax=Diachasmimorpha longicaudata TaxID=58733 RepID=UPI0030B8CB75